MDFGVVGLVEGLVGPEDAAPSQVAAAAAAAAEAEAEAETKQMVVGVGSGLGKQGRSASLHDDWADSKIPRTDDFGPSITMSLHHGPSLLRSNSLLPDHAAAPPPHHHILSFSSPSPKSDMSFIAKDAGLVDRPTKATPFPYYHQPSPSAYNRNAGFGSGSLNTSMHGAFSGIRGPFTPSQWIELEHQALIYKYITANVPVPSNLLIPIRKSLNPFGLSASSSTSLAHNPLGWGSFHLGFSGNTDPEPGRCRRTDGKKWRCSRDAVADQKYCERHINRGRHRSRKPVEGQTGHAVSGPTNSKVVPMPSTMSASVMSSRGGGASNSLAIAQNQFKSLQPVAANPSADTLVSRLQEPQGLSMISPTINLKSRDTPFSISKLPIPFEESSQSEFGLVSSDSLLNPSEKGSYIDSRNYTPFLDFSDQETQDQHPFRQFMDDWPKDQSNRSGIAWPEELKSDWTQLSISIPMSSSDFSSSSSSPTQEKLSFSPLRLSRELDPGQMGLGVSSDLSAPAQKQTSWIPISWGSSMGGPLGEVLTTSANNMGTCKNSSALNLMTEGWDGSPQIGSSPTGVLQKSTFGSLSNSSSGSSPRTENQKTRDRASHSEDMLGSTLATSSSIPSL